MLKKVVYIVSDIDKALAFEWIAESLQQQFNLQFILIGKQQSILRQFLAAMGIPCHVVSGNQTKHAFLVWWKVFQILKSEKPAIIHTHLWRANLFGLTAAWLLRIPKRIYTRHHATIHHREYPSGLKWDKLCNIFATDIVAISENVKKILIEQDRANAEKIQTINHGFDVNYFEQVDGIRVQVIRQKLNIDSLSPVIGVIARYTKWKGVQYVIDAFNQLRGRYPQAVLVLANAQGDYAHEIKLKLKQLPANSFREIIWEEDLAALYKVFDVYVHVPTDEQAEAFGQTYVEALVSGVPSVFTLSGVAAEFIHHKKNAWVVPFKNAEAIQEGIIEILENQNLRQQLIENGRQSVNPFSLDLFMQKLKRLYER